MTDSKNGSSSTLHAKASRTENKKMDLPLWDSRLPGGGILVTWFKKNCYYVSFIVYRAEEHRQIGGGGGEGNGNSRTDLPLCCRFGSTNAECFRWAETDMIIPSQAWDERASNQTKCEPFCSSFLSPFSLCCLTFIQWDKPKMSDRRMTAPQTKS